MDPRTGRVWTQTNEPQNAVVELERTETGTLGRTRVVPTGGAGSGVPHLTSQGSVVLSTSGRHLLVTNAASDDVSVFGVADGELTPIQTFATGAAPKSVAERDGLVYVMNTGKPSLIGFRLAEDGLSTLPGTEAMLSSDEADPAQVGFAPDGSAIVVTERGTDSLSLFPVQPNGTLGMPLTTPSSGPTPYGFAFTGRGTLIVTEAFRAEEGAAAASSYRVDGTSITAVSRSIGNGRSEICWAVVTNDGRYAFATNFADGAVSRYAVADDGSIALDDATAGVTEDGRPGLRDVELTRDGRFLYALDAERGEIAGWAVGEDGSLSSTGSWGGLPITIAGLAAS